MWTCFRAPSSSHRPSRYVSGSCLEVLTVQEPGLYFHILHILTFVQLLGCCLCVARVLEGALWFEGFAPLSVHPCLQGAGSSITHVYHCAYLTTGNAVEDVEINMKMFKALVEGAEAAGCKLQHVYCMEGTKWYGKL